MRALVISGTWGKNATEQPIRESHNHVNGLSENARANIFNGGTIDRLKAIMHLADEYDCLVWRPTFETNADHVNPKHYVGPATPILA